MDTKLPALTLSALLLAACAVDPTTTTAQQLDTDCCSLLPDVDAVRECIDPPLGTCVELTCGVSFCNIDRHYWPRPFVTEDRP